MQQTEGAYDSVEGRVVVRQVLGVTLDKATGWIFLTCLADHRGREINSFSACTALRRCCREFACAARDVKQSFA
jgi:hypothetical protein